MNIDHRRSPRNIDYLPLEVHVVQAEGRVVAGPFSGRIIDISGHGACLLMSQIIRSGFHLFLSTRDNKETFLQLTISNLEDFDRFIMLARPVWMADFQQQGIRAFKMGVCFAGNPEEHGMKELLKAIQENQAQRGHWWKTHCKMSPQNNQHLEAEEPEAE